MAASVARVSVDLPSSLVSEECTDEIDAAYLPFVSSGFVSLTEDGEKVPIKILRDSSALSSFILASVLPFPKESDTGMSDLVLGMGCLFGLLQYTDYISFQTWSKGRWASQYVQHCR